MSLQGSENALLGQRGNVSLSWVEGESTFESLRDEWNDLWRDSPEATESQTWDFVAVYSAHIGRAWPTVIVARDAEGRCVSLAALARFRDPTSLRRGVGFVGAGSVDYHVMLARPGLPSGIGSAMLDHIYNRYRLRVPRVELHNIPAGTWTAAAAHDWISRRLRTDTAATHWTTQTFLVPLPKTLEEYVERLGPSSRRDFRYDRRRLQRDFRVDVRVFRTPSEIETGQAAIEVIDRARWGRASRFRSARFRAFSRSAALRFGAIGIYRALVLYLNDRPVSHVYGCVVGDEFKVTSIAYDPGVPRKYSVGMVTNGFAIEHCIQEGMTGYDLSRGSEEYKKWLGGTVRINEHFCVYRSQLDRRVERWSRLLVTAARRQSWLRTVAQRLRG